MIPVGDVIPSRTSPLVVRSLAAVSTLVFALAWPGLIGTATPAAGLGLGLAPVAWTWYGAVASLVLQPGGFFLAANLLALWLFGGTVEDRLGHGRFALLWGASGLAAAAAQIAAMPSSTGLLLGSTGAVAGVIGAKLALYPRARILAAAPVVIGFEFVDVPAWLYAAIWASVLLAIHAPFAAGGLAAAMIAGLGVGAIAGRFLRRPERMAVDWWCPASEPRGTAASCRTARPPGPGTPRTP